MIEEPFYEGNYIVTSSRQDGSDSIEKVFTERRAALEEFEACVTLNRIATLSQLIKHNWKSDIEQRLLVKKEY